MVALVERSKWEQVRIDYEIGSFKSLKELAERHSVDYQLLRNKIYSQKWRESVITRSNEMLQKVHEVKEDLASEYLSSTFKRAKRYEKIIDASQNQQATNNDGIPLLDVDAIEAYTRAESRIHDMAKSALRISDKVDVTTNGQSIGDSFVSAISKLRESPDTPKLTSSQIDSVLEAEIIG